MIDVINVTGSLPFDLSFTVISFFAISSYGIKIIRSIVFGRVW